MARKRAQDETPLEPELRVNQDEATAKLADRIVKGHDLLRRGVHSIEEISQLDDHYDKWNAYNRDLLTRLFTTDKLAKEYSYSGAAPIAMLMGRETHAQKLARIKEYISGK